MKHFRTIAGWREGHSVYLGIDVLIFLITVLSLIFNTINHKFFVSDFRVYYDAAKNLLDNGSVYFIPYGESSGTYKYSPLTLMYFLPFTLLDFRTAATLHICILALAYRGALISTRTLLTRYFFTKPVKHEGWLLVLVVVSTMIFFVKEVYLGNVNILLIFLSLIALRYFLAKKPIRFGLLFSLVLLAKPFFVVLLLPFLWRKEKKAVIYLTGAFIAGVILPSLFFGMSDNYRLTAGWIKTMVAHNAGYPSYNSIEYLISHYFTGSMPSGSGLLILLFITITYLLLKFFQEKKKAMPPRQDIQRFLLEWFLLLALLPNIFPMDTEHFLASIPAISFLIYYISVNRKYYLILLMVVLIFFYGANSQDLLGRELSDRLFKMGLIGVSNIFLVLLTLIISVYTRHGKQA